MSEAALKALSNSQLASGSEIPAVKHRTVNDAIIEELFDAQSRADVLSGVQVAGALAGGDRVLVIRSGQGYLLDADDFGFIDKLVNLTDVNITSPINNQVVAWDAATSRFVAKSIDNIPQGATVNLVGNQTVNGIKTFASAIVQSVAAENPNELTRLDQVEQLVSGISWRKPIIEFVDFTTAEPSSPTSGDRYINTVTGSGSITTGQTFTINRIYEWNGSDWIENTPSQGWTVVNNNDGIPYNYNGTQWVAISSGTLPNNVALTNVSNEFEESQTISALTTPALNFKTNTSTEAVMLQIVGAEFVSSAPYNANVISAINSSHLDLNAGGSRIARFASDGNIYINQTSGSEKLDVNGNVKATEIKDQNGTLGKKRVTLGSNPTALDAEDYGTVIGTATYTASTTLTFSNAANLDELALQITNTNANVITFAGVTLYFKSADLPSGVTFGSNALTFPADSAVKYNITGVKFDGTTIDCKLEIR